MVMTLCCLLWAHAGREADLTLYEDRVLAFLPGYGATLVSRLKTSDSDDSGNHPTEIQLFEFPSQESLDAYLDDPRRVALTAERDLAIARTDLMNVTPVKPAK